MGGQIVEMNLQCCAFSVFEGFQLICKARVANKKGKKTKQNKISRADGAKKEEKYRFCVNSPKIEPCLREPPSVRQDEWGGEG